MCFICPEDKPNCPDGYQEYREKHTFPLPVKQDCRLQALLHLSQLIGRRTVKPQSQYLLEINPTKIQEISLCCLLKEFYSQGEYYTI